MIDNESVAYKALWTVTHQVLMGFHVLHSKKDHSWRAVVRGDYYVTLLLFIMSFQKKMLPLTTLNAVMGYHLDFT